ncbi:MAG: YHS domain-containing (seleno)protein [Pseudomonadota bacterium]
MSAQSHLWSRRALSAFALLTLTALVGASLVSTAADAKSKRPINTIGSPGVAIKGFDPVAYFTVGKPTKGKRAHEVTYKGAKWRFASAENKAKFEANPAKYEPAYGGYCAYGVAQGYLVKIEGNAWAIRNGRLYLNYDRGIQRRWSKAPARYVKTANAKWPRLIRK